MSVTLSAPGERRSNIHSTPKALVSGGGFETCVDVPPNRLERGVEQIRSNLAHLSLADLAEEQRKQLQGLIIRDDTVFAQAKNCLGKSS